MRLALVTEGMIHRSLDDLLDWLDEHVPERGPRSLGLREQQRAIPVAAERAQLRVAR